MAQALNLSNLASDLNGYFRQFKQGLKSEVQYGFVGESGPMSMETRSTLIPGVVDELILGNVQAGDFLRQFNPTDTNTFIPVANTVNVGSRTLQMRKFKGDLLFLDDRLNTTFLMWQAKMEAINQGKSAEKEMSFIEYLFMNVIIKSALRSIRKASFQSVFSANGAGWTSGSPLYGSANILDGMEKLITTEINAGTITPHVYNASNNVVTEVEAAFLTLTSEQRRADNLVVLLREDIYNKWITANRSSSGLGRMFTFNSTDQLTIDGYPNTTVLPDPDLSTYKAVIYQKENYFISVSMEGQEASDWEFQRLDRTTKCMLNGEIGCQFETVNPGNFVNVAVMS